MPPPKDKQEWVQKHLGVKSTAKNLNDKDFPTDAKQRQKADAEARRLGEQRLKAKDEKPGKGPPKDPADALIDEALGDPQKRLEALAKWKVPRYSDAYKNDTPESQFLSDLDSGITKAQEYFEFINKACAYAEKYGDLTALKDIGKAAAGLKKITGQLSSGLGKVGNAIKTAKQIYAWIRDTNRFADASAAMDPRDRESVKRWVAAMQDLWDSTAPFAQWLQNKAATAAIVEGSEAAASLSATLAIVGAQLYIGIKLLDAGVKAEAAYFDRMDKIMQEIDRQAGNAPPPEQREPPPGYPGDWVSREEAAQNAPAWEDSELKIKIRAAERAKREEREEKIFEATRDFDANIFPKVYVARRPEIRARILAALRKAGKKTQAFGQGDLRSDGRSHESRWWDCLMTDGAAMDRAHDSGDPSLTGSPFFDRQAGIYVYPTKAKVSISEAAQELSEFQHVSPPCPFLAHVRQTELSKYLAKKVPPTE